MILQIRRVVLASLLCFSCLLVLKRPAEEISPLRKRTIAATPEPQASKTQPKTRVAQRNTQPPATPQAADSSGSPFEIENVLSENVSQVAKAQTLRVRVVKADYRYPNLRLEETWQRNPVSGIERPVAWKASVADRVLIRAQKGADANTVRTLLDQLGLTLESDTNGLYIASLPEFEATDSLPKAIQELAQHQDLVQIAEPDYLQQLFVRKPNDPLMSANRTWGLDNTGGWGYTTDADIDAPEAWAHRTDAPSVVVAVIDSGIRATHEDLKDNLWRNPGEVPGNGRDNDNNGFADDYHGYDFVANRGNLTDPDGHGTHVAGTIGARGNNGKGLTGVAWNVQLMALRFIDESGYGTTSDAIRAINYARLNGAHIINASWGSDAESQLLKDAIAQAGQAQILFVAAAGNDSRSNESNPSFPANYALSTIISVAATDPTDQLASFSNFGSSKVDIAAPGDDIYSTYNSSDGDYEYLSGTSMAAPHVSGILALLKAEFPSESAAALKNRLYQGVDRLASLKSKVATSGRVNLAKSLILVGSRPANDDIADAHLLEGNFTSWLGSNDGGTMEANDPTLNNGNRSIWFAWTAPFEGWATLAAEHTGFRFLVFDGEPSNLQVLPGQEATGTRDRVGTVARPQQFRFYATQDQNYHFGITNSSPYATDIEFSIKQLPPNDNHASAIAISQSSFNVRGSTSAATKESGEPDHAEIPASASVWYHWTPDQSGEFILSTSGSDFDTTLAVYQGNSLTSLQEIASNDDFKPGRTSSEVIMDVVGGESYHIAIDSAVSGRSGNFQLIAVPASQLSITQQPESVQVEEGLSATFVVDVLGADEVTYQWYHDRTPIPEATQRLLHFDQTRLGDAGSYHVTINSERTSLSSDTAMLTVSHAPPQIIWQTGSMNVLLGEDQSLRANVKGSEPITYQWYRDGVPISGATDRAYTLTQMTAELSGNYQLEASNVAGTATSSAMIVTGVEAPWDRWRVRNPLPQGADITTLIYTNNHYLGITASDTLLYSPDGSAWDILPSPLSDPATIAYGNGRYVLSSRREVTTSTNLTDWSGATNTTYSLDHLTFASGKFFAIVGSRLKMSTNGTTWTEVPDLSGVSYLRTLLSNGTTLFAASSQGTGYSSTDGETWSTVELPFNTYSIASGYVNGQFMVIKSTSSESLRYTSVDGHTWKTTPLAETYYSSFSGKLAYDGRHYIATSSSRLLFSEDALKWDSQSYEGNYRSFNTIAVGNNHAVAAGSDGVMLMGKDLRTATITPYERSDIETMVFEDGQFIAPIGFSKDRHMISGDGIHWSFRDKIASDPDYSKQGATLHARGVHLKSSYYNMHYSTDGENYTQVEGFPSGRFYKFLDLNQKFFALFQGYTLISSNGTSWSEVTLPSEAGDAIVSRRGIVDIIDHGGKLWAMTGAGYLLHSTNGSSWTQHSKAVDTAKQMIRSGEWWLILDSGYTSNKVYYSKDLSNWVETSLYGKANGIVAGAGTVIAYGDDGVIMQGGLPKSQGPSVTLQQPLQDTTISQYGEIDIVADATDQEDEIERVELHINDQLVETLYESPFRWRETFDSIGSHVIEVRAFDSDGLLGTDRAILEVAFTPPHDESIEGTKPLFTRIHYHDGLYIASTGSSLYTSPDALHWQRQDVPTIGGISQITSGTGVIVAVTRTHLIVSHDALHWFIVEAPGSPTSSSDFIEEFSYQDGRFYFETFRGQQWMSDDEMNWQKLPATTSYSSSFVAGNNVTLNLTSPFDTNVFKLNARGTWDKVITSKVIKDMAFGADRFVLVTSDGSIQSSIDGNSWQTKTFPDVRFTKIEFKGSRFFAFAQDASIRTSTDGIDWQSIEDPSRIRNITYGADAYVALSREGFFHSYDGVHWTKQDDGVFGQSDWHVVYGVAGYAAVAGNGKSLANSADGLAWQISSNTTSTKDFYAVATSPEITVAVGKYNTIYWSVDHETWHPADVPDGFGTLNSVIFGNGLFIAVGSRDTILSSSDGQHWETVDDEGAPSLGTIERCHFQDDTFVLAGSHGFARGDGSTFTYYQNTLNPYRTEMVGDKMVAFQQTTRAYTSTDLENWNEIAMGSARLYSTAASATRFLAATQTSLRYSDDGENWNEMDYDFTLGYGKQLVGYDGGFYMQTSLNHLRHSVDGETWDTLSGMPSTAKIIVDHQGDPYLLYNNALIPVITSDWVASEVLIEARDYQVDETTTADVKIALVGSYEPSDLPSHIALSLCLSHDALWGNADDVFAGDHVIDLSEHDLSTGILELSLPLQVPPTVDAAAYAVGVHLDPNSQLQEVNSSNNYRFTEGRPLHIPGWSLQVTNNGPGSVIATPDKGLYPNGSSVTLIARPGKDALFLGWNQANEQLSRSITVTMDQEQRPVANFEQGYRLQTQTRGRGSISVSREGQLFPKDTTLTLTAIPAEGWQFVGWEGDLSGAEPSVALTMDQAKRLRAIFEQTYEAWKALHFNQEQLADAQLVDADADPDGDGRTNWQEYTAATNPTSTVDDDNTHASVIGDHACIIFQQNIGARHASVKVEQSTDLAAWTEVVDKTILESEDGIEVWEARTPFDPNDPAVFMRLVQEPNGNLTP